MRLKSSRNKTIIFIGALLVLVLALLFLERINNKPSKYAKTPDQYYQKTTLDLIQVTLQENHYDKLKKKRDFALSQGILETEDSDYVPAMIAFNGKEYKAEVRLKGDWTDHLVDDKWSFRIKLMDDMTILGMRKFSIHHPKTRGYINEWLYHKAIKKEELFGLRYGFLEGSIHIKKKGSSRYITKDVGVYAIEETFDKRTIESNKRKESIILKFDEGFWWQEVKNSMKVVSPSGLPWNTFMDYQKGLQNELPISVFSEDKVLSDTLMNSYFKLSKNLLNDLRFGKTSIDKVFDVKKLALQNAILNLFGGVHGTYIINLRFYYNPITSKLEPIAFDGNSGIKLKKYTHFLFTNQKRDSIYLKELALALNKVSDPEFLDVLFQEHKDEIEGFQNIFRKEFIVKGFALQNLQYNQQILRDELARLKSKYNLQIESTSTAKQIETIKTPNVTSWIHNGNVIKPSNEKNKIGPVFALERKNINVAAYTAISKNRINYGQAYEASIIAKKNSIDHNFGLRIQGVYPNRVDAVFNLEKGKVEGVKASGDFENGNAKIQNLGNGWYKCSVRAFLKTSEVSIILGPTNNEKQILNWEGPISHKSNVYIVPSSLTLEEVKN